MSKRKFKVAICQRGATGATVQENMEASVAIVEKAMQDMPDADVVQLPELNLGIPHSREEAIQMSQPIPGPYTEALSAVAKKYHVNIVTGSFVEATEDGHYRNTLAFINREGEVLGKYSKVHLMNVLGITESKMMDPGTGSCVIDTDIGRVGLQVCYDCRFPELARTEVLDGAEILFISAAFPGGAPLPPRTDHWDTLINAMALQNLTWVSACNQFGDLGPGAWLFGRSRVVDPWGTPIAVAGNHEDVFYATVDLDYQDQIRASVGGLSCRRPDIYKIK